MSMRIDGRIPEFNGDALLEPFGDEMLQPFRLLMDFFQRVIQHLEQKCLDQSMMTQDFERASLSRRRQTHTVMALILD